MSSGRRRTLVLDCFSGIAGDMVLAALVDAGARLATIQARIDALPLPPVELIAEPVRRGGISALHVSVRPSRERRYTPGEMRSLIENGDLPARAASRALKAVELLAGAEGAVHEEGGRFHEVGGVDALVDIIASMLALEELAVAECFCPVVTVGAGTVARTEHGLIPAAPGPAAAHILREARFPLRFVPAGHELVTPTGAAILAACARPETVTVVPEGQGYGAGSMNPPDRPNALRVFLGRPPARPLAAEAASLPGTRPLALLEANIDDMAPSLLAHARDRLLEEGALDAWIEPIGMKKGRAAAKLCALAAAGDEERLSRLILQETTTLGVRVAAYHRFELARRSETVMTAFGPVRVKYADREGRREAAPEYDDVVAIAAREGLPAREVDARLRRELQNPDSL